MSGGRRAPRAPPSPAPAGRRWRRHDARRPRRLRQRVARETPTALAAACAVKPSALACRQRSRASRPCAAPRNVTRQAEGRGLLQAVRTDGFGDPLFPFSSSVSHVRELGQQDYPPTAISAKASNPRENLSRTSRRKGWGLRFAAVEPCMPTATQAFFELAGQARSAATSRAAPEANLRTRSDKKRSRLPGCPPLAPDVPRPPETRQPLLLRQRRPGGARRLERRTTALRRQRHRERRGAGPETGVERRSRRPRRVPQAPPPGGGRRTRRAHGTGRDRPPNASSALEKHDRRLFTPTPAPPGSAAAVPPLIYGRVDNARGETFAAAALGRLRSERKDRSLVGPPRDTG